MASSVILKTTQMFLILLCGVLVYKTGLLDSRSVRKLSDLLLLFVMPLLIFQSYQADFDRELLYGLFRTLINGLLGAEGVFYITAFSTMSNLFLWTHGVIVMAPASSEQSSGKSRAASMAALLRNLLTPAISGGIHGFHCGFLPDSCNHHHVRRPLWA